MVEKVERQINLTNLNLGNLDFNHANVVHNTQNSQGFISNDNVVVAMNAYNGRRNNTRKGAKCTYCGMIGHTIDDKCYKKHGYPSGWVPGYKYMGK